MPVVVGYAVAVRVSAVAAGSEVKVRVEVFPEVGRATVWVETTVEPFRNETVMLFEADGMRRVVLSGQVIVRAARPVAAETMDEAEEPPPQPARAVTMARSTADW